MATESESRLNFYQSLKEWAFDQKRQRPELAFSAGQLRDAASAVEWKLQALERVAQKACEVLDSIGMPWGGSCDELLDALARVGFKPTIPEEQMQNPVVYASDGKNYFEKVIEEISRREELLPK